MAPPTAPGRCGWPALSNTEIAADLVVEESTVKTHVSRILLKLGQCYRLQGAVIACKSGFVVSGQPA